MIGIVFTPIIARTVRAAVLSERELDYVDGRPAPERAGAVHPVRRDPAERARPDHRRVHRAARLRDLHDRHALVPRLRDPAARRRTGACRSSRTTGCSAPAYWWPSLFPALAIATLVIAVNLDRRRPDRRRSSDERRARRRRRRPRSSSRISTSSTRVRGIDRRQVLRGVSLSIAPGESYGLVGESGCGKSTAALAVDALPAAQRPRHAAAPIRVGGRDLLAHVASASVRRCRSSAVSMVYQNPARR